MFEIKNNSATQNGLRNISGRVIVTWGLSKRWLSETGEPRALSTSDLHQLIRSINHAFNPETIAGELERTGVVARVGVKWCLKKGRN